MTLSDVAAQLDALIQEWQTQESSYSEDRDVSATALVASSWLRECISDLQALRDTLGTPEVDQRVAELEGQIAEWKERYFALSRQQGMDALTAERGAGKMPL